MLDLEKILGFVRVPNQFQRVERMVRANSENRWENDVEHSYNLAMLAWYIVNQHNLPLNRERVITYALVHDFVEVYAGDTYIYTTNEWEKESKSVREKVAAVRLQKEFAEFTDLHGLIEKYEKREDAEARFVYALDKIHPILNIYTDGGRTWREKGITIEMLAENKRKKVAASSEIAACFDEIIALLRLEEKRLFTEEVEKT